MIYFSFSPLQLSPEGGPRRLGVYSPPSRPPAVRQSLAPESPGQKSLPGPLAERSGLSTSRPRRPTPAPWARSQVSSQPSTDKPEPLMRLFPFVSTPAILIGKVTQEPGPGQQDTTSRVGLEVWILGAMHHFLQPLDTARDRDPAQVSLPGLHCHPSPFRYLQPVLLLHS